MLFLINPKSVLQLENKEFSIRLKQACPAFDDKKALKLSQKILKNLSKVKNESFVLVCYDSFMERNNLNIAEANDLTLKHWKIKSSKSNLFVSIKTIQNKENNHGIWRLFYN